MTAPALWIRQLGAALLGRFAPWRPGTPAPIAPAFSPAVAVHADPRTPRGSLEPSLALVTEPTLAAPHPAPPPPSPARRPRPWFARRGTEFIARLELEPGASLYGTGEAAGPLLRNGRRTVCWNTDAYAYRDSTESLYQSHPWVLGVRRDGSAFGVLADTSRRCAIDLGDALTFRARGAPFRVLTIEADTPQRVLRILSDLTGRMDLPPRWALGYHQCRYSYESAARALEVAREFRRREIPCDVLWLDIDYMDGFRCFTFDPVRFPDPRALNDALHELGFRTVWMIDPGIKAEPGYHVYDQGRAGDHFIRRPDGAEYHGKVWPGPCAFPDFTRAATRDWWASLYEAFMANGIDGVWNDMNEPAVFEAPGKTMPDDLPHRADPALGGPGPHARFHNVYGTLMARATRAGVARANPRKRPFVLTRAGSLGSQRDAATWTGDNTSDWDHLAWSIPMILNLGLSGQPFAGPDIGGFIGDADETLFARWIGIGSLLPFARGHSEKGTRDHEPWSFGARAERVCRAALQRRSRLLPYLYTLAWEASRTGLPIARPLFFADPRDPALRDADDAFLLGADLMVRCRVTPEGPCRAPTPRGPEWPLVEPLDALDPDLVASLPELRLRPGAILPLAPVSPHASAQPASPVTLLVRPDPDGLASGTLYEDDGDGHDHRDGAYQITRFRARRADRRVEVTASAEGTHTSAPRHLIVRLVSPDGSLAHAEGPEASTIVLPA
ncbi:MAG: DUF5110 domain-containing protein [Phycisphaerae bacterium]|nr:DUF5110 domain-containing protein [Phycisphaerae bacterium]